MTELPVGAVKKHPDYPGTPTVAIRTQWDDSIDNNGCLSWLTSNAVGRGSHFVTSAMVADWPDVDMGVPPVTP
jgi:hypothetical protein